ncbi:GntR family transcriptional regulator [Aquisalimonas lutea]|uniref:GntR family transcriptional regulator n=1 Tax=Aquisalimonas lutea TaxID=1327750 RepID=UPI0025B626BB|nr:GntR family transcriptional regulator [Aquisalimonas lutea]MDN3518644.1 GntR family transcriptional regulator [Aquisalimonas lutea]
MARTQQSGAARLRDSLEDDIVNGRLRPGEKLDPEALGRRFGVSRTPVREAIQHLESSGLVTVLPKRGTFVTEIGIPRLIEMFEVMAELEAMSGRLAARRIEAGEAQALSAALQRCRDAADRGESDEYYYENERFHYLIYAASHNGFLADEAKRVHGRLKPYRRLQLRVRNRMYRSLAEHETIVAAIVNGDETEAERCLKAHILVQGERFSDLVASLGDAAHLSMPASPDGGDGDDESEKDRQRPATTR